MKLYALAAVLEISGTKDLRKVLANNGFMIHLHNRLTGENSAVHEDFPSEEEVLQLFRNAELYQFDCVYSSFKTPPKDEIIQLIKTHPQVKSYTDQKLDYGK